MKRPMQSNVATPAPGVSEGATLEEMRNFAAREAERLGIWESVDLRPREDRAACEGLVRMCDALLRNKEVRRLVAAEIKKWCG